MKSLKRTTVTEFQDLLGLESEFPIVKTLIVTALESLSPEAKQDIIQFLTPMPEDTNVGQEGYVAP